MKRFFNVLLFTLVFNNSFYGQIMPSPDENIPFLVTFSKSSDKTWGDDDNIQIYFFSIPQDIKTPFYIRIYVRVNVLIPITLHPVEEKLMHNVNK